MKSRFGMVMVLAALVAAVFTSFVQVAPAEAQFLPVSTSPIPLAAKRSVSGATVDSLVWTLGTRSTSENPDTLATIDTADWDWVGPAGGVTTSNYAVAYLNFTVASGAGQLASGNDSLHVQYQTSPDNVNFSAVSAASLITWNAADVYGRLPVLANSSSLNASAFFGQRYLRFIVCGDTGGKIGGMSASYQYFKRKAIN